ncbi:MAG: DVUA0089 family protein [Bryobacteraceae bacterium]|nr:DVUA0089 family protein [Bryobacteraceae bacterium]
MSSGLRWAFGWMCLASGLMAAPVSFSGTFTNDGNVAFFNLTLISNGVINVNTWSYGGRTAPAVPAGGFAPSLGLYDEVTGNLVAIDPTGGTVVGGGCSPSGQRDPVTGFCQDAHLSFSTTAGNYVLALAVQPNNPPGSLTDAYLLAPGANFSPGPFADPGDFTGATLRTGAWFLEIDLNGTASQATGIPEPSTASLLAAGVALAVLAKRKR